MSELPQWNETNNTNNLTNTTKNSSDTEERSPASLKQKKKKKRTGRKKRKAKSRKAKVGVPWTEAEHRLFLHGMVHYSKGEWRNIARNFVPSRTPSQVASHAQKYFLRQEVLQGRAGSKRRRRPSIHDITVADLPESEEERLAEQRLLTAQLKEGRSFTAPLPKATIAKKPVEPQRGTKRKRKTPVRQAAIRTRPYSDTDDFEQPPAKRQRFDASQPASNPTSPSMAIVAPQMIPVLPNGYYMSPYGGSQWTGAYVEQTPVWVNVVAPGEAKQGMNAHAQMPQTLAAVFPTGFYAAQVPAAAEVAEAVPTPDEEEEELAQAEPSSPTLSEAAPHSPVMSEGYPLEDDVRYQGMEGEGAGLLGNYMTENERIFFGSYMKTDYDLGLGCSDAGTSLGMGEEFEPSSVAVASIFDEICRSNEFGEAAMAF